MPPAQQSQRTPAPRRKACDTCSEAKMRCDHKQPECSRCQARGLLCTYPADIRRRPIANSRSAISRDGPSTNYNLPEINDPELLTPTHNPPSLASNDAFGTIRTIPRNSHLDCNIDAASIQSRWLRSFVPEPGDQPKSIPPGVGVFMSGILQSYTNAVIRGSAIPPFIHVTQLSESATTNQPLTNCYRLLRICDDRLPGSQELVLELINREMKKLLDGLETYDAPTLLTVFQAYLLYSMTLLFSFNRLNQPDLQQAILDLQKLASDTALDGVITPAEKRHARPEWITWIQAEAKRRTLYTFYLFDNLLCMKTNIPVYLGTELKGMLAPAKGELWRAVEESDWQRMYTAWLASWDAPRLTIDELWPLPAGSGAHESARREERVARWLEGADEAGTAIYAITTCTHTV